MRRWIAAALLASCAFTGPAHATALTPRLPLALYGDESVAVTDDARAMLFDPAATGVRYPAELFAGFARSDGHHEWNSILATRGRFGFYALRQRDTSQTYGFSLALGGEKFRVGWSPYWLFSGQPTRQLSADHRIGLLARPAPWASLGLTVDHLMQPVFRDERRARNYTLGVGLRPLAWSRPAAHTWGTRLTLSSDVVIVDDGEWRQARVRTGAEFEALPGLSLRVMAEDHRHLKFGVSLRGLRFGVHAGTAREDFNRLYDEVALTLHGGEDRTLFAPPSARRVAVLRAGGVLGDESISGLSLTGGTATTSSAPLHRQLERALEDPLTRGVLLELRGVAVMAQLEELRPRIAALRAAGKPVVAYFEYGGGRGDLYLASACDRIVASEDASFGALGLRVERRYYRKALADLGVRMDRSSIGAFKSAYRNYSVDSTPAADSLAIEQSLTRSQSLFVNAVAADRHLAPARLEGVLDGRPWSSADLAATGVIDSVGYREDALRVLGALTGLGAKPRTVSLARPRAARRAWTLRTPVAVVYAGGAIDQGRSGNDLLGGPYMGDETMVAQLEHAFHAPGVRAVVLRIESPGGSVLATNLIDHAIQRLKRETRLPLIVSMGSVAASGGYYIAMHADRIYADHYTRTGSIGVLFVKPSLEGFYARHHVHEDDFSRGDAMQGWSYARDWTPAMQATADSMIHREYDTFVGKVAEGRRLPLARAYESAQGRVWFGDEAHERGLVDAIGGFEDALAEARRRAGVPAGEKIRLVSFGRPKPTFFERFLGTAVREAIAHETSLRLPEGLQMRADDPLATPGP